jgi:hypothetical protein
MPALSPSASRSAVAERDAGILDRVVVVDVQVALRLDLEVDHRVPRQLVEHVVEEADPGAAVARAGPVEVERDRDLGLGRPAAQLRLAHGAFPDDRPRGAYRPRRPD